MGYVVEKLVSSPEDIIEEYPLSQDLKNQIQIHRKELCDILEGKDKRKIVILGPCSAWPSEAVYKYAKMLKSVIEKIDDEIKVVLRVYTQKPRTALGWMGPAYQADPFKKADIDEGIRYCRKMMLEIASAGIAIADEALFTHIEGYFSDILSWVAIGARSSEDQEHRVYASMINHPVGIKNPTHGREKIAINSIIASQNPQEFLLKGKQICSTGNSHAHLVLRGMNSEPNLDEKSISRFISELKNNEVKNPAIIADVSHDNSIDFDTGKKDYSFQGENLLGLVEIMKKNSEINSYVKGFMLESFIKEGKQDINSTSIDEGGLSITDACLGFENTEKLLLKLYEELKSS